MKKIRKVKELCQSGKQQINLYTNNWKMLKYLLSVPQLMHATFYSKQVNHFLLSTF